MDSESDHAGVNFPPPLIHAVGLIAAVVLNQIYPLSLPQLGLLWWVGVTLTGFTFILASLSFRQFSLEENPVAPNQQIKGLMTSGPFRYTRNPLYLALALLHIGIALISGIAWLLMSLLPVLLIVRYYVIAREEAYLTRQFGQAYLEYQRRVHRWF
ncbi:MAG: isoprenylcysteine carboxylmethyltransferase family protein [Candidatus Thiodiazotropha sp. L084R]